jgi:hypothetical protein
VNHSLGSEWAARGIQGNGWAGGGASGQGKVVKRNLDERVCEGVVVAPGDYV